MKNFNLLILTIFCLISSNLSAQNIKVKGFSNSNAKANFKGKWAINNNSNNKELSIFGDQIANDSKSFLNNLIVEVFLVPVDSEVTLSTLTNNVTTPMYLGNLQGNNASFRNVRINIGDAIAKSLNNGIYNPILILKDFSNNTIINYRIIETPIGVYNNSITMFQFNNDSAVSSPKEDIKEEIIEQFKEPIANNEVKIVEEKTVLIAEPKIEITATAATEPDVKGYYSPNNINKTYLSSVFLPKKNNKISFDGIWKLEVDFANAKVDITGKNNNIKNLTSNETNDLKLMVYFSAVKPKLDKELAGYEVVSVSLNPFGPKQILEDVDIESDITRLIPRGTYYAMLVLLEKNKTGGYDEVSTIIFEEKFKI